jgi:hypothetical protein
VALVKGLFEIPDRQVAFDNEGRRVEYVRERRTRLPLQELERRDDRRYHEMAAALHSKQGDLFLFADIADAARAFVHYAKQEEHLRKIGQEVPKDDRRRRNLRAQQVRGTRAMQVEEQHRRLRDQDRERKRRASGAAPREKRARAEDSGCAIS